MNIVISESKESSTHSTPTPLANHSSSSTPVAALTTPQQTAKPVARYPVNIDPQVIADFKVCIIMFSDSFKNLQFEAFGKLVL